MAPMSRSAGKTEAVTKLQVNYATDAGAFPAFMEIMKMELIAAFLIAHECATWTHPGTGEVRIYLNRFAKDLLEIEATYYKTGNLCSFYWHGEKDSNSYGRKILSALDKAYFSKKDGRFHAVNSYSGMDLSDALMEAVTERMKTENFQAAA